MNKYSFKILMGCSLFIILGIFIYPTIGAANNGDFYRLMQYGGYIYDNPNFHNVFDLKYNVEPIENIFKRKFSLISSSGLFIFFSRIIFEFLRKTPFAHFDIRIMGGIYSVFLLILSAIFFNEVNKSYKMLKSKIVIGIFFLGIFYDVGYLGYFNSFYSEPAIYISCLFMLIFYFKSFKEFTFINLIIYIIATWIFLFSKMQTIIYLPLIIFFNYKLLKNKKKTLKIFMLTNIIFLIISSFLFYSRYTKSSVNAFKYPNLFNGLFTSIILDEKEDKEKLSKFGIDEKYSVFAGRNIYEPEVNKIMDIYSEEAVKHIFNQVSQGKYILFYLSNPKILNNRINKLLQNSYNNLPPELGYFTKELSKEKIKPKYMNMWNEFRKIIGIKKLISLIVFSISSIILIIKRKNLIDNYKDDIIIFFIYSIHQLPLKIVGDGLKDMEKHTFLYNLSYDILIIFIIIKLMYKIEKNNLQKKEREQQNEKDNNIGSCI